MSDYIVRINTDNAAFGSTVEEHGAELARILHELAERLESGDCGTYQLSLRDVSGNKVGTVGHK